MGQPPRSTEDAFAAFLSAEKRTQMLRLLPEVIDLLRRRRSVYLANESGPAVRFRPVDETERHAIGSDYTEKVSEQISLPGSDDEIAYLSLIELADLLRRRELTSRTLTQIYLARLKRHGPALASVATLTEERAMREAELADEEIRRGHYRGVLHGVPWGAKDLLDTAGISTCWGAEPYAGLDSRARTSGSGRVRIPDVDAAVVARLAGAGSVLAAKLSLGALAYGDIWYGGRTNSPWDPRDGSSGSSAGSAASVAAGLVGFAIGTETMGSIVSPSLRCGTAGLRPTFGRVPRTGAMALCWSFDKIGPLCRSVRDCMPVLAAIAGSDGVDPDALTQSMRLPDREDLRGMKVGYDPAWFAEDSVSESERSVLSILEQQGFVLHELSFPPLPYESLMLLVYVEAAAAFEDLTSSGLDDTLTWQADDAWPNTFRTARLVPALDYVQVQRFRRELGHMMNDLFRQVDFLVSPGTVGPLLLVTNATGHPSLTLRSGFVERGSSETDTLADVPTRGGKFLRGPGVPAPVSPVPRGVNLWGRLWEEGTLCAAGEVLERELDVWRLRPPVDSVSPFDRRAEQ